ncbi:GNAT family N-acetyltransferase [Cellulomonas edaphi]|uniref:N-acetyltransferase n=1 Tax=Cellulomonas edaphi TaxID=3053468 RepID=A0ABT7S7D7_9CELL|nr:N-acetyltransferase [Cellulomons edaphi]MDM7830947.1 N-acetyltransferase [Cellulomons edaphi]
MLIDDEVPADREAVRAVVRAAFASDGDHVVDLLDGLQSSSAARPGLSLVAREAGSVVGHVLLTRSWLDAPQRLLEVLVLSPLAVAPDAQRRGVGTALVGAALARAEDQGWPLVFLEGDPAYYGDHGFVAAGTRGFTSPTDRIPEPAFQVAVLAAHRPWMTGRLVYADPFWVHDAAGLRL